MNPSAPPTSKSKVLVVDDEPRNLQLVGEILRRAGIPFVLAVDGKEALDVVEAEKPALILLDIMMPGENGIEVCKRLKASPETREIPVIFLTAATSVSDVVAGFAAGASDFVRKPFIREELVARVSSHLQIKAAQQELEARAEERTQLLARLAHDIKNPAGSIEGLSQMLRLDLEEGTANSKEEMISVLKLMEESAVTMFEIVNGILDEARSSSTEQNTAPDEAIDVAAILEHLIGINRQHAVEKLIEIVFQPSFKAQAAISRRILVEIYDNLVSNAIKYSRHGGKITIRLQPSQILADGFRCEVEDSAKRIPPEKADALFESFNRGDASEETAQKSHGVGLSIVKRLVSLHGGEVGVTDAANGGGNIFYVEMPLGRPPHETSH